MQEAILLGHRFPCELPDSRVLGVHVLDCSVRAQSRCIDTFYAPQRILSWPEATHKCRFHNYEKNEEGCKRLVIETAQRSHRRRARKTLLKENPAAVLAIIAYDTLSLSSGTFSSSSRADRLPLPTAPAQAVWAMQSRKSTCGSPSNVKSQKTDLRNYLTPRIKVSEIEKNQESVAVELLNTRRCEYF